MQADFKVALRRIAAFPGFAFAVLVTLALTIALSTTVFSVLDAMFFRPLPYADPQRIVELAPYSQQGFLEPASYPEYLDWRRDNPCFSALAAYAPFGDNNLDTGRSAVSVHSVATSDNFFAVFGIKPLLGRTFDPGERNGVVLSEEIWRSVFSADPRVVGTMVRINGTPMTIVGVMPRGFRFPISRTDAIYFPLHMPKNVEANRGSNWLRTVARLKPGWTIANAQQAFNRVLRQLASVHPESAGRRATLADLPSTVGQEDKDALRLLFYAVLSILAIGCVNLSGMLLARAIRFQREMAVRAALGASRFDLVQQILMENLVFGLAGAGLGVVLAYALLQAIRVLLVSALPRGAEVHLSMAVLCAALACSIGCSLLAGLAPALGLSGSNANLALRSGGRTGIHRRQVRLRSSFVMLQVTLALTLLFTAGLVFRTLSGLLHEPMGFDPAHILNAEVDLSSANYANKDMWTDFYVPLLQRVRNVAGVRAAGLISVLPIQGWGNDEAVHMVGEPPAAPNENRLAEDRMVSDGYYKVFGIQTLRGELLDDQRHTPNSPRVQVVNQRFADRFIPKGRNPIGMYMDEGDTKVRIIGVTSNVRHSISDPPLAEMDWPMSQIPYSLRNQLINSMHLVIRTDGSPLGIIPSLRLIFHQLDPSLPFRAPATMQQIIEDSLRFERLENWLFGSFAALAFLLAVVGLYGVIHHEVQTSTRAIGIRIAVGARWTHIAGLVYKRVMRMLAVGALGAAFASWAARTLMISIAPVHENQDVCVFVAVLLAFVAVAAAAALVPARTAAKVDPVTALRAE